jgi:acetyl esterase/lipase
MAAGVVLIIITRNMQKRLLAAILLVLTIPSSGQHSKHSNAGAPIHSDLPQISLWPGPMPDGPGPSGAAQISDDGAVTNVSNPRLIIHLPEKSNGTAILVMSGGGYARIERGKESLPAANWLQSQGITAFELIYRLPREGWLTTDVPFEDAQRAMRIIRRDARKYGIDPGKIGVLGFSAGGHLAGITACLPDKAFYKPVDITDSITARPDFAAFIYPVLTMLPPYNKTHAKKSILGADPATAAEIAYSVERQVTANTPRTFLAQSQDDPISPIENSFLMYRALQKAGVPSELHTFKTGGHGWGMGKPGAEVAAWPMLFKNWAVLNGYWKP